VHSTRYLAVSGGIWRYTALFPNLGADQESQNARK
jgi:hypothetical protein